MEFLKSNYKKFKKHFRSGGIFYTLWRGIRYFIFLIKKQKDNFKQRFKQKQDKMISRGKIKLVCSDCGVDIFWNGRKVTEGNGLNTGINTLGFWTNSAKSDWQVLRKEKDSFKIKVVFRELPLSQTWILKIKNEREIDWQIDLQTEEWLRIDESRIVCLIGVHYKSWLSDYQQGDFIRLDNNWHDLCPGERPASLVGVRFPIGGESLPAIALEAGNNNFFAFIQNPPANNKANIIGFRYTGTEEGKDYPEGYYRLFSGKIAFFEDNNLLDAKTEAVRQNYLESEIGTKKIEIKKSKQRLKILLINLPWQKEARWGVRAGSRWPHIKDDSEERSYLPFPFFLAYSANLLRKYDFRAYLIDAIAEKITENKLLEHIDKVSPDLLVAETSTPSLNYDLRLLEKFSNKNFKIAICGPDTNIRNAEFLKARPFIDYVLCGEYEYILLNLVKNLSRNKGPEDVNGIIYRDKDGIKVNPPAQLSDLDSLPWPLREDLPMDRYLDTPGRIPLPSVQMLASRGCPFTCNFCLWPQVMYSGNKYRARNVIDVVDEMEYLVNKMGFKSVYFDDDTFNVGKERMLRFCQEVKNRSLEKIPWAIMARPDLMDEETLIRMKEAGLAAIKYGVESASQELLDNCGKGMDLKKAEKMILFTKKLDIKTHLTFTFGLPGETHSSIQKTIDYALKLRPYSVQFSITTPFPGTAYFNQLDKKGLIVDKNWDDYDGNFRSVIKLDSLSNKDLESARHAAGRLWNQLSKQDNGPKYYWNRFNESFKQGGLKFTFKKTLNYFKEKRPSYITRKIRDNYLDILGILNGKYAFKGPHTIQIDLTDYCNNNCIACWCNSPLLSKERLNKPKDVLPLKSVKELIAETSQMGTKEIYFSGGGEPFMHPHILEIIQHAKKMGLSCAINTNFTLVDEKVIHRLIDLGLDNITVSVWAGTADIYRALHPNREEKDFYRIYDTLLLLNTKKNTRPYVKVYNVICNLNYYQIKQMFDFARQTKSEFIEFTVLDTIPDATDKLILSEEQLKLVLGECGEIKQRISEQGNSHNPQVLNFEHFLRRLSNSDAKTAQYDSRFIDDMPCYAGWLFARIMPNGDVNSCLKSHRFPVGNIHRQTFKNIWNSKKQIYFREKTLSGHKDDPFFALIGNDPDSKIGCFKSCDDIDRNISMHSKIKMLSDYERFILNILGKTRLAKFTAKPDKR